MALVNVVHKAITGRARQFDGTYGALTDIMDARSKVGLVVGLTFNSAGSLSGVTLSGGQIGATLTVAVSDWVVFPDLVTDPAFVLDNAHATAAWQIV